MRCCNPNQLVPAYKLPINITSQGEVNDGKEASKNMVEKLMTMLKEDTVSVIQIKKMAEAEVLNRTKDEQVDPTR